jgi:hypothetical protein
VSQALAASIANMHNQLDQQEFDYEYGENYEEADYEDWPEQEEEVDGQSEDSITQVAKRQKVQGEAFDLLQNLLTNKQSENSDTAASAGTTPSASDSVDELLAAVQQEMEIDGTKPAIDAGLAKAIDKLITVGLPEDKIKPKLEKYQRPANCDNMVKVKVNTVIWDHMTANVRSFDLKLQKAQNLSVKTMIALTDILVELRRDRSGVNNDIFEKALDALSFAAAGNKEINLRRRELIKPDLNQNYKALCNNTAQLPITSELFGSDITTAIKDQTEANKISKQLGNSYGGGYGGRRGRGSFRGRRPFYRRPFLGGRSRGYPRGRGQYQYRGGRSRGRGQQGAPRQPQSQA